MGLYLRKSFRLGPLRLNVSTYGIGLSTGVKGARFGVDAGGHPYVHAGRHGLYYRRRWPAPPSARPVGSRPLTPPDPLPPLAPPPAERYGRIGWGWVVAVILLVVWVAWLLGQ